MATTTPRPIAALDVPAEQRHAYRDLDADSACYPEGFACPAIFDYLPGRTA
ncbi:hypothetical protein [Streptomyces sp. NEAU-174]|uniref:hypothetical protein n=1 Tax=Streptomyces sp. NEAU-174 TaxID=3458254 RepID=UPI0040448C8C